MERDLAVKSKEKVDLTKLEDKIDQNYQKVDSLINAAFGEVQKYRSKVDQVMHDIEQMTADLERNEKKLEQIKDNDPMLTAQSSTTKVTLPTDYPAEEEESSVMLQIMQDIAQFQ